MKKILSMAIAGALAFAGSANAADVEAGVVKNLPSKVEAKFLKQHSVDIDTTLIDSLKQKAPAQGISHYEVIGVLSSQNNGWENLYDPARTSTVEDHGGSSLYVAVLQVGYGNPNQANMNGISKSVFLTENRCGSDLHVCNVGETITGFVYYYNYSGQQSGLFQTSANSVANPFGYWSDSIYIR